MIVIEGPDHVGKTTFCYALLKVLQEEMPYVYRHHDRPPACWTSPESWIANMQHSCVYDRFYLSDLVYREGRGEQQITSPEAQRIIDAHLRLMGTVTVVIVADGVWHLEKLRQKLKQPQGGDADREQVLQVEGDAEHHYQASLDEAERANCLFGALGATTPTRLFGYKPDIDFFHRINNDHEYPGPMLIGKVLRLYRERQLALTGGMPEEAAEVSNIPPIKS